MSRADYAHWNEDADYMWWHEEGKHVETVDDYDDYDDYLSEQSAVDAFAEEVAEKTTEQIYKLLCDADYRKRWPMAVPILEWELDERMGA